MDLDTHLPHINARKTQIQYFFVVIWSIKINRNTPDFQTGPGCSVFSILLVLLKTCAGFFSAYYSIKNTLVQTSTFINIFRGVIGRWKTSFSYFFLPAWDFMEKPTKLQNFRPWLVIGYCTTRKVHRRFRDFINVLYNCIINDWRGCKYSASEKYKMR